MPPTVAGAIVNLSLSFDRRVPVNLNFVLSPDALQHSIEQAGIRHVISSRKVLDRLAISFEPVEGCLGALADYIGPHKILWATDYPHPDGFFPGAPDMIRRRTELSEATRREILGGGARGFYKL